ncbi:MAG: hypothetical protein AB7S44_02610 [Spirochaetales bacterium]
MQEQRKGNNGSIMDFTEFIGRNKELVLSELEKLGFKVTLKENGTNLTKYDTELVVRIKELKNNHLEVLTDRFLIEI